MTTKHTLGPWTVFQVCDELSIVTGERGNIPVNSIIVADILNKNKANAALIAAAPELLEALEQSEMDFETMFSCLNKQDKELCKVILPRIKAAIAKAKGEA